MLTASTGALVGTYPAGNNPLYKVVAYIPNSNPDPITDGINSGSCSCDSLFSGTPIATGISGPDGSFSIPNAPVGTNIPIVIQIGKWRNYFTIPSVACGPNDLDTLAPKGMMGMGDGDESRRRLG